MNVHGDLRHAENYEGQANLTPEQRTWSQSWDMLRRLQSGKGKMDFAFAGLVPAIKRITSSLGNEFLPSEDVLCVTMLPMAATKSTRFHKDNRPVRLQVTVSRFHRDESGRPALGGGSQYTVFEADGSKHPTQDHPMVRVVDYDPRRGETEERFGLSLFGQEVSAPAPVQIKAPAGGIFVSDDQIMNGWIVYLLDGLPIYRFPEDHAGQIALAVEEGAVVQDNTVLATITGERTFAYHRTIYMDGKPDLDDDRVLSPLRGETSVQVDDLYANVFVTAGQQSTLVARFHADDVASGKVLLSPEREVRGTGKYERTRDRAHSSKRVKLRTGNDWSDLVKDDASGEAFIIARLVSPVEYGLADFYPDGKPVWDRVNFTHDIIPVSRPDCKAPLRLVGKMLAMAKKLMFYRPADPRYPTLRPVDDHWPKPYAVFSRTQLARAGTEDKVFNWGPELQEAARFAVSPKGDFNICFHDDGKWTCTGYDDDASPVARTLFFKKHDEPAVSEEYDDMPTDIELGNAPWPERRRLMKLLDSREANPEGDVLDTEEKDSDVLSVVVPKSAVVRKDVYAGAIVTKGDAIADWVPRQFYPFEELRDLLGNNLGWFLNEFLQHEALPQDNGCYLLPESHVAGIVKPEQGLVLRRGVNSVTEEGVMLLTPLRLDKLRNNDELGFTWNVNGILYDVAPPHLVVDGQPPKKRRRRRDRDRKVDSAAPPVAQTVSQPVAQTVSQPAAQPKPPVEKPEAIELGDRPWEARPQHDRLLDSRENNPEG